MTREEDILKKYDEHISRKVLFIFISIIILFVLVLISVSIGPSNKSLEVVFYAVLGKGSEKNLRIVWLARMPRVVGAILAGLGLSVAGATMQSLLRNPLGSPSTMGISSAAAFGAAFSILYLGAGTTLSSGADAILVNNPYLTTMSAFVFAMISTMVILLLVRLIDASPATLILTGVAMGSLFQAGTLSLQYFTADETNLAAFIAWTFGDIGKGNWNKIMILAVVVIPVAIYFIKKSWDFNALDSGDETAKSLGVDIKRTRIMGMIFSALITAVVVSFFGIISFVGLVVPHIIRRIIGGDERYLVPASVFFGAAFLLACDTAARTVISPEILPVGILTSFMGAPLFIYVLIKGRAYW